jgi:hypothetical protein
MFRNKQEIDKMMPIITASENFTLHENGTISNNLGLVLRKRSRSDPSEVGPQNGTTLRLSV